MPFLISEDEALKSHLQGMEVAGRDGRALPVRVWFRWPEQEEREIQYPFITIELGRMADQAGITVGVSRPSSTRLDAEARGLPTVARASPHYYNTDDEVDQLVACVGRAA